MVHVNRVHTPETGKGDSPDLKRYPRRLTGICGLIFALFILFNLPAAGAEPTPRVLILPLTIHSEKDLTFLNQGIMDMLASRISQSATVIRQTTLPDGKDPLQMGRDLKVDYVVTGSLTIFGNSASTDGTLTTVQTGEPVLHFSQFGQSSSDVLMHVDQFGTQVSRYIASKSAAPPLAAPADAAPAVMVPQVAAKVEPAQPPQPAAAPVAAAAAAASSTLAAAPDETQDPLWTSNPFKGVISALATADVDGDGKTDIVFIHEDQVVVERFDGVRLDRLAAFDVGRNHKIVAVDAGDINGNQTAEIFVSRLNPYNRLDSIVLEWNGTTLAPIAGDQPWYFRVIQDPQQSPLLLGQRAGTPSTTDTGGLYNNSHFRSGVFELTWTGKEYQTGRRLPLPSDTIVYRIGRGDVFNDGTLRTIAYSADDELRIYDPSGEARWAGKETYGGNPLFLEYAFAENAIAKDRMYLTQRLIVADLDGDGAVEVTTVHNRDAAKGFVERFRQYTSGRVIALRWNKVNMKPVWEGEAVSGYISDFSLADLNGDGRLEAVYAMVASTGLARSKSSNVVIEQIGDLSGN